jgi:cell division protein ZapA (FtsZ GTPase activity inhibitor)
MKVLITILIGLLVVGCGKSESERLKEKREQMERDIEKLEKAHKALKDLNDAKRRNDP